MITNPTPQRQLRGHMPARPVPKVASSHAYLATLSPRLTPRDRWLTRMLHEHQVLTTPQIVQLAWPSLRSANLRLRQLYTWRVINRFQPFINRGTAPMHYVLDVAGAHIIAAQHDLPVTQLGYRDDRVLSWAHSLQLAHRVGISTVFADLIAHAREPHATGRLTAWWSEERCQRLFGHTVRPDGYGRWHTSTGEEIEWFLEYDFGTEALPQLAAKLRGYHALAAATSIATPVLIWLPTARRETTARQALAHAHHALTCPQLVPVATTHAPALDDTGEPAGAAGARWLPLHTHHPHRLTLAELANAWPTATSPRSTPTPTAIPHPPATPGLRPLPVAALENPLGPPPPMPP